MRPFHTILAVSASVLAASSAVAQAPTSAKPPSGSWILLGSSHAKHTNDHDTIYVDRPGAKFRLMKVAVDGASLHMRRMVITYANGAMFNIPVRYNIQKGSETRAIPLDRAGRDIRKVDLWYDTKGWLHGTAEVRLYARS